MANRTAPTREYKNQSDLILLKKIGGNGHEVSVCFLVNPPQNEPERSRYLAERKDLDAFAEIVDKCRAESHPIAALKIEIARTFTNVSDKVNEEIDSNNWDDLRMFLIEKYIKEKCPIINVNKKRVYYKENKHGHNLQSRFEDATSRVAASQLLLTPKTHLVKKNDTICGLITEDIEIAIKEDIERRKKPDQVLTLCHNKSKNPVIQFITQKLAIKKNRDNETSPTESFFFLDKLRNGALNYLEKHPQVTFDKASLASVLCTSYALEEDDLHKGNIGFYVVKESTASNQEHYRIVFFKIDHDMMFYDSIVSFMKDGMRPYTGHSLSSDSRIPITVADLENFPYLSDASPHYWPTIFRQVAKDEKKWGYEIDFFRELKDCDHFKKSKWQSLLKSALMSPEMIDATLSKSLDEDDPYRHMMASALTERFAELKAVMLASPEFRKEFPKHAIEYYHAINAEYEAFYGKDRHFELKIAEHLRLKFRDIYNGCVRQESDQQSNTDEKTTVSTLLIHDGDTPLHTAIKFNLYRYDESIERFSAFLNEVNSKSETPLQLAVRQKNIGIVNSLLRAGAEVTKVVAKELVKVTNEKSNDFYVRNRNIMLLEALRKANPGVIADAYSSKTTPQDTKGLNPQITTYLSDLKSNPKANFFSEESYMEIFEREMGELAKKTLKSPELIQKLNVLLAVMKSYDFKKINYTNKEGNQKDYVNQWLTLAIVRQIEKNVDCNAAASDFKKTYLDELLRCAIKQSAGTELFKQILNFYDYYDRKNNAKVAVTANNNTTSAASTAITALKEAIKDISQDTDLTLAQKKQAGRHAFRLVIKNLVIKNLVIKNTNLAKQDIDNIENFLDNDPSCKFLSQLTSKLWFIRNWRGSHGTTSTVADIKYELAYKRNDGVVNAFMDTVLFGRSRSQDCRYSYLEENNEAEPAAALRELSAPMV